MRYDAVIFDLYGTLVPSMTDDAYADSIRRTAHAVGADPEAFFDLWTDPDVFRRRDVGTFRTQAECIAFVAARLGLSPGPAKVARAARLREEFVRRLMVPRPDAVGTLRTLRARGLKLGLMSAASRDTPVVWPETPFAPLFDAALFSCEAGVSKPDPRFYRMACDQLDVTPDRCLYVGDGFSDELAGAQRAGMRPVLICPPAEEQFILTREGVRDWPGARIRALSDVPRLLGIAGGS